MNTKLSIAALSIAHPGRNLASCPSPMGHEATREHSARELRNAWPEHATRDLPRGRLLRASELASRVLLGTETASHALPQHCHPNRAC